MPVSLSERDRNGESLRVMARGGGSTSGLSRHIPSSGGMATRDVGVGVVRLDGRGGEERGGQDGGGTGGQAVGAAA
jgi:hypothetical protein